MLECNWQNIIDFVRMRFSIDKKEGEYGESKCHTKDYVNNKK